MASTNLNLVSQAIGAFDGLDDNLAREITYLLCNTYPGYRWDVNVDSNGGVIVIYHFLNTKDIKVGKDSETYGYIIKYGDLTPFDSAARGKVKQAGGELLERAGLCRRKNQGIIASKFDIS